MRYYITYFKLLTSKPVRRLLQASLLSTAALTAEVGVLKQDLERSEQELGLAKKQLEDKEGE